MRDLKEVLEQNKEKYIEELKNLVGIDTHDLGHGIDGGLEKQGQEYMVNLFESMGADEITVDPMDEAVIQESYKKHQEGNLGHNQTDRANVYATFKGKLIKKSPDGQIKNSRNFVPFCDHLQKIMHETEEEINLVARRLQLRIISPLI